MRKVIQTVYTCYLLPHFTPQYPLNLISYYITPEMIEPLNIFFNLAKASFLVIMNEYHHSIKCRMFKINNVAYYPKSLNTSLAFSGSCRVPSFSKMCRA